MANVGAIFNMFGAYGDVVCIKILKNKRDCALVQMAKPHHALQVRQLEPSKQLLLTQTVDLT